MASKAKAKATAVALAAEGTGGEAAGQAEAATTPAEDLSAVLRAFAEFRNDLNQTVQRLTAVVEDVRVGQAQVSARMDDVDAVVAGLRAAPLANPSKPPTRGEALLLQQQQQQQQQPQQQQQLVPWLEPLSVELRPFAVALLAEPGPLSGTTMGALSGRQKNALLRVNVLTGKVTSQSVPGRAAAVDAMVRRLLEAVANDNPDDPVVFVRFIRLGAAFDSYSYY